VNGEQTGAYYFRARAWRAVSGGSSRITSGAVLGFYARGKGSEWLAMGHPGSVSRLIGGIGKDRGMGKRLEEIEQMLNSGDSNGKTDIDIVDFINKEREKRDLARWK